MMGHAFDYARRLEPYSLGTRALTDLAIWMSGVYESNLGASKLLQVMHLEYDLITSGDDLSKYRAIVMPDKVRFCPEDKAALLAFVARGGKIIASYESIFDELGVHKIAPSEYTLDYIKCDLEDCKTPFLAYSGAYKVKSDGEVLAEVYEPYFNRTHGHFCGHKNTPNKTEPADYPALVRCGGVIYFAHPVFDAYNRSGNYILEEYIIKAIDSVYERAVITEELPSSGRIRVRESEDKRLISLHVLYAPPVNRGNVCLLPDFPKLHGVKVSLRTDKKIKRVYAPIDGEEIAYETAGDRVILSLPPFSLHKLIVLEW